MATIPQVPRTNSLFDTMTKTAIGLFAKVNQQWDNWFQLLAGAINRTAQQLGSASLSTQSASVSATNLNSGTLSAGLYRVSYSQAVTRAATGSSSLTSRFDWTFNGVAQSVTNAAMTGNTTTTHQEAVMPIQVDASTNVTYTLTYASSGATSMQYAFRASLEALP